jgi:hypothetical protein
MVKRNKPLMGTQLVPSIENIEGCHKWGGRWDRDGDICFENMVPSHFKTRNEGYMGCTAPIKGISVCWGSRDMERIKFYDHILAVTGELVHSHSDKWERIHPNVLDEAEREYKFIKDAGYSEHTPQVCINPLGKITGCEQPNAIFTNNGKNITAITHSLRGLRKQRPLANIIPRQYEPTNKEYTKGDQMEIEELSSDLPVLMRRFRDKRNDKDYFPADKQKSNYPPLDEMEVPSIESIKHCFEHGGYWNGWWNVCVRRRTVGPHRGVQCHFGSHETDDMRINEDNEEEWDTRFEPFVWCKIVGREKADEDFWDEDRLIWDTDQDGWFNDYWSRPDFDGYSFPDNEEESDKVAKSTAIDYMHSVKNTDYETCYTPEGRKVKNTNPRAICAPREKVLKIYGGKK